jgi:AhpD family alkylhydroperoxidase
MDQRMQLAEVAPEGYRKVYALEAYVSGAVEHNLYLLLKLRASVVNGCAFCVDMHGTHLLDGGEDVRRVLAVSAWRESPFFTERERVAFALTDEVTRLGEHGVSDEAWDAAVAEFGDEGVANLLLAIATINTWNRLAVASHAAPPPLASLAAANG